MPKIQKDPYAPRKCRFCKMTFKPRDGKKINPANAAAQEFCCPAHRKEFWKHGSVPVEKLILRSEKRFREIAREELSTRLLELIQTQQEEFRRIVQDEIRIWRQDVALSNTDPEADEPACIDWERIYREEAERKAAKR